MSAEPTVPLSVESPISASLQHRIDEAIAAVPAGKQNALRLDAAYSNLGAGVQAQYAHRFTPTWSTGVWGALAQGGRREAGLSLTGTW